MHTQFYPSGGGTMRRLVLILLLCLLPVQGWAATAHVQKADVRDLDGNTTVPLAFGSNVTTGNGVAGALGWKPTTSNLTGVTVCGNAATLSTGGTVTAGTISGRGFYYLNVTTGACTVTATFDANVTDGRMIIHELSGEDTGGTVLSACNGQAPASTGTDTITSGNVNIVATGDYIFGANFSQNGTASTPGSTPTYTQGVDFLTRESEYIANYGSSGNTPAVFSTAGSDNWVTCVVSFPAAGGGGAAAPKGLLLGVYP